MLSAPAEDRAEDVFCAKNAKNVNFTTINELIFYNAQFEKSLFGEIFLYGMKRTGFHSGSFCVEFLYNSMISVTVVVALWYFLAKECAFSPLM